MNLFGMLVMVALIGGLFLEPYRFFQAVTGRLTSNKNGSPPSKSIAPLLFIVALPFWVGVLWAYWNVEYLKVCSGDNCIGYMLLGMPFPLIYVWAELLLLGQRIAAKTPIK